MNYHIILDLQPENFSKQPSALDGLEYPEALPELSSDPPPPGRPGLAVSVPA